MLICLYITCVFMCISGWEGVCFKVYVHVSGLPQWLSGKESAYNAENLGLIPGLGRSPGEVNGSPLQCSGLENPMDRGTWRATVQGVTKS